MARIVFWVSIISGPAHRAHYMPAYWMALGHRTARREEIPVFVGMQKRLGARGLQFIGIAIDRPDPVRAFQREYGMNYPILIGGIETMELLRATGNKAGVLPYTLIIDKAGRLSARKLGVLKEAHLEAMLEPLF